MASIREALPPPVVAADRNIAELTVKALILGALLSMILAAANAYIGLLVGLTVSASIPAAAASMGILRLFRRSTILENNMVQTAASAGESLVAGIIFTIPALVMMRAWSGYEYGPMVAIGVLGGILGQRPAQALRLRRQQGGGHRPDQSGRGGLCRPGYPLQCGVPGDRGNTLASGAHKCPVRPGSGA